MIGEARTGVTTYETPTEVDIVITRVVDALGRIVFDAWTNRTHVQQWLRLDLLLKALV